MLLKREKHETDNFVTKKISGCEGKILIKYSLFKDIPKILDKCTPL